MTASVQSANGHGARALVASGEAGMTPGTQLALLWVSCRIDHHVATPAIAAKAKADSVGIFLAQRFSDRAPSTIDHRFTL